MPTMYNTINLTRFAIFICISTTSLAFDNGPQVLGCDLKFGKREFTDICLITGSGTNQGITWVAFRANGKDFVYSSSEPKVLRLVNANGDTMRKFVIKNRQEQCRPGGINVDVYRFQNGDRICLYWPQ
ncbi:hypothetical protein TI04_00055 [Achromatium sp. WMS2]|nr:hypothetical protein TI04_00055 [Achromatium sp. WMS2]